MGKKTYLPLLALTLLTVASLHVEWTTDENGILLVIDNNPIDFFGSVDDQWNRVTRNCNAVTRLSPKDERYGIAESLIKNYSPPNSQSAMIASAWSMELWTLVEVEFKDLLPAVVLIQATDSQSFIVPNAVCQ